jgi:hypothetical protein
MMTSKNIKNLPPHVARTTSRSCDLRKGSPYAEIGPKSSLTYQILRQSSWGRGSQGLILWQIAAKVSVHPDPFNIMRDAEMQPWLGALRALRAMDPLIVCPGHGAHAGASALVTAHTRLDS